MSGAVTNAVSSAAIYARVSSGGAEEGPDDRLADREPTRARRRRAA
jgi:hypothetical protein